MAPEKVCRHTKMLFLNYLVISTIFHEINEILFIVELENPRFLPTNVKAWKIISVIRIGGEPSGGGASFGDEAPLDWTFF